MALKVWSTHQSDVYDRFPTQHPPLANDPSCVGMETTLNFDYQVENGDLGLNFLLLIYTQIKVQHYLPNNFFIFYIYKTSIFVTILYISECAFW